MTNYILISKLGAAEIRAMQQMSAENKRYVTPLIEITKGRKLSSLRKPTPEEEYPFDKYLEQVKSIWEGHDIIMDLTSWDYLSNVTIDKLYDFTNGYEKWCTFIEQVNKESNFNSIIPCVITNADDPDLEENLCKQVDILSQRYNMIAYRSDIADDYCYDDIKIIKDHLNGKPLLFIIDAGYVPQISIGSFINKIQIRIDNIRSIMSDVQIAVSATSFPNNISEIGGEDYDKFLLSEVKISDQLKGKDIIYSDYGCVNPQRNDGIVMARGWIPRIDVPLSNCVFYHRKRRPKGTSKYSGTYKEVAAITFADKDFPMSLRDNWGIQQIQECAKGAAPSSQPNFWISVRMSIHVETQIRRINNL